MKQPDAFHSGRRHNRAIPRLLEVGTRGILLCLGVWTTPSMHLFKVGIRGTLL